jgi:predicted aldo/keto reductase-like oxidoreductase
MKTLKEFSRWLEEEQSAKTPKFSIKKMKQLGSGVVDQQAQVQMYEYLNKTLGASNWSGSFRYTWILDDQRVLKLIKGVDRISQNKQELKNSQCLGPSYSVQVLDHHPQFYWLIEERVEHVDDEQLVALFNERLGTKFTNRTETLSGIDIDTTFMIMNVISDLVRNKKRQAYRDIYKHFENSEWFVGLLTKLKMCKVSSDDFITENWGLRKNTNELVLLDLGF